MDAITAVTAIVSTLIAAVSLFVAYRQYQEGKKRADSERERLASQRERLRTATLAAVAGVESADLIVQRAKNSDATIAEVQNLARVLRGTLNLLARQLEEQDHELQRWEYSQLFVSGTGARAD